MHWIDKVANDIEQYWGLTGEIICNGGLSVSGLQHVGRLRGEIVLVDAVRRILEERGRNVRHLLVLYTQDNWKGKDTQLRAFKNSEEASRYKGWRLMDVPDPEDCHRNWVEHYWKNFGGYLHDFAKYVEVYTTTQLYKMDSMKEVLREILLKKEDVRAIINKYRGRRPYPENWIPYDPLCGNCLRIDSAEPLEVDLEAYKIKYVCKNCGYSDWCSMEDGKLNWRLEWTAIWKALKVMFEPYGKDHATPGGSRDSCVDLAVNALRFKPPIGVAYEWVGYVVGGKDLGDMGSSDFIGFTPEDWVKVAEPEVLRYYYIINDCMKRLALSLDQVYHYVELYDFAERVYYGVEKLDKESWEIATMKRSFELSQLKSIPREMPFQLKYLHAVILVQTLPEEDLLENAIRRLKSTGVLLKDPDPLSASRMESRLRRALNWLKLYAPSEFRVRLLESLPFELKSSLSSDDKDLLKKLIELFESIEWGEEAIKQTMMRFTSAISKGESQRLFKALYLIFFGRVSGPRIAPYLAMLNKGWVLNRLKEAISMS
ncbi:lysine--tRNA ligase [Candidatus Bathyarchaeota archaeon]|nr:lysine--tRNA ligase [Candidatus Bathyarchaeota archaeon]MBS7614096.1 lysine--tRNA ligase [Candidatus Bathyarchaeota archaeon]MBS7618686.1 lysine--tRNA ligase [Candidatus Bathyarchaeota archaeon]